MNSSADLPLKAALGFLTVSGSQNALGSHQINTETWKVGWPGSNQFIASLHGHSLNLLKHLLRQTKHPNLLDQ